MARILNPTMTCGQCSHFEAIEGGRGYCSEGAELMIFEGMPRAEVIVRDYASAESCPHFDESVSSRLDRDPMPGWDEGVDRAYKTKKEAA